jgi:hypothetical protein
MSSKTLCSILCANSACADAASSTTAEELRDGSEKPTGQASSGFYLL